MRGFSKLIKCSLKNKVLFFVSALLVSALIVTSYDPNEKSSIPGFDRIAFLDRLDPVLFKNGELEMKNHKVIFTGITRDNARDIPTMLAFFEKIGSEFKDFRVVVFENDSSDDTLKLLEDKQKSDNRFKVISKKFNLKKRPSTKFLADIRNNYLSAIESNEYDGFDIVIIVDIDMRFGIDKRSIEHSFSMINRWDAVCSNGIFDEVGTMYDGYAFRDDKFLEDSEEFKNNNNEYWNKLTKYTWKVHPVTGDLIKVNSCFGGLAIYKKSFLEGCKYDSINGDCEHIPFHRCIIQKNKARMFMNPAQILRYEHYPGDRKKNFIKKVKKLIKPLKEYMFGASNNEESPQID